MAAGRKLATIHLNVSNRQMCGCTGFKSGSSILCQDKARDFTLMSMGTVYFIITSKNQNILFHIFHIFAAKLKHAVSEQN